jgi:hypothetical protein
MEMNNKGWLRIVEASVAVMIVLSILFFIYLNKPIVSEEVDLSQFARDLLEESANNVTLRERILNDDYKPVNDSLSRKIPLSYKFELKICAVSESCGKSVFTPGEIYAAERVITTTLSSQNYQPRKVRLFIWRSES